VQGGVSCIGAWVLESGCDRVTTFTRLGNLHEQSRIDSVRLPHDQVELSLLPSVTIIPPLSH
jgi:hypothetical protein